MALVMPVNAWISPGMLHSGFTSDDHSSTRSPSTTRTMPISVTRSPVAVVPVVSRSTKATAGASMGNCRVPPGPFAIRDKIVDNLENSMARTRAKSPPRLTRDAERLIALANGLNASGSLTEDRFWEGEMSAVIARLLENGNDAPIDGALDHLYQTNLGAYDTLIELAENESESAILASGGEDWQVLLVAAPIVAWSKYEIPSGTIDRAAADALRAQLQGHVLADATRVTLVPYLYSIDQLPRHFSELRKLTVKLGESALAKEAPRVDFARLPETAHLLADTRFLIASVAAPRNKPLFRWQEDASGHAGRAGSLEQWIAQARPTISKLLPGCVYECLLPDAYYVNCRESDRRVRPFGIRAAVAFLENALKVRPAELQAVVAGFGEDRVDEYRIAFSAGEDGEVAHGVVWPLYGREDET